MSKEKSEANQALKLKRQAKHVVERVRREAAKRKTVSQKKIVAMLESPYTASEPRNGVIYVTFDENGAGIDN